MTVRRCAHKPNADKYYFILPLDHRQDMYRMPLKTQPASFVHEGPTKTRKFVSDFVTIREKLTSAGFGRGAPPAHPLLIYPFVLLDRAILLLLKSVQVDSEAPSSTPLTGHWMLPCIEDQQCTHVFPTLGKTSCVRFVIFGSWCRGCCPHVCSFPFPSLLKSSLSSKRVTFV